MNDPTLDLPNKSPQPDDVTLPLSLPQHSDDRTVAGSFTDEAATIAPSSPTADGSATTVSLHGYEILAELGRGGMGVVYKARHVALNRTVALKMILAGEHAGGANVERFLAEAEAVAAFNHPNVVQVFEVGRDGRLPFMALEFIDGGNLADRVKTEPLPAQEAARIVESLARGLQAAHQAGIVHRDLKPANVLMTHDGTPKVTDFGLAKRVEGGSGLTQTGAILGTPSYMAPEQAMGEGKRVGPAADIYALGAILYELLTGRPPFRTASPLDTIMQVINNEPVPPRQLNPTVPRDLETIALKCLQKEPAKRYERAQSLADDLRRWQAGAPITARPIGKAERAWRWVRRNPVGTVALSLLAVLFAAAVIVPIIIAQREAENTRQVTAEKLKAENAERRALQQAADYGADSAQQLCEQNRIEQGMISYVRALRNARLAGDRELEEAIRLNLGAWSEELHSKAFSIAHDKRWFHAGAFHPDGKILALLGWDWRDPAHETNIILFIDVATGKELPGTIRFSGANHAGSIVWSSNGDLLAAYKRDGLVRICQRHHAQPLREIRVDTPEFGDKLCPPRMAFSPDGKRLIAGCKGPKVKIYHTDTGQPTGLELLHGGDFANGVDWSSDGRFLLTGRMNALAQLWDAETGKPIGPPANTGGFIVDAAFSPDGTKFLTALGNGGSHVRVWHTATSQPANLATDTRHNNLSATFSPDSRYYAASSHSTEVLIWEVGSLAQYGASIRPDSGGMTMLTRFRPDGRGLLTIGQNGTACLWNLGVGRQRWRTRTSHRHSEFTPDGKWIFAGTNRNVIERIDRATGQPAPPHLISTNAGVVNSMRVSPDSQRLYATKYDGRGWHIECWDIDSARLHYDLVGHPTELLALSPDGQRLLASTAVHPNVNMFDARDGKWLRTIPTADPIRSLQWHPNGNSFARLGEQYLQVHDLISNTDGFRTSNHARKSVGHYHPDGKHFLVGSSDLYVHRYELPSGRLLDARMPHSAHIYQTLYTPNSLLILTADVKQSVRLWHAATAKRVGPILRGADLKISHDNKAFLSHDQDTIRLFDLPTIMTGEVAEVIARVEQLTGQRVEP